MKRTKLCFWVVFAIVGIQSHAAYFIEEEDNGDGTKSCIYNDGSVILVADYRACPSHNVGVDG